jgi:hypothetical protein
MDIREAAEPSERLAEAFQELPQLDRTEILESTE